MAKTVSFKQAKSFTSNFLDLGDGQQMHYRVTGNPKGQPVVYLHGGPGAAGGMKHTKIFDQKKWLIIIPDQRGCGLSTPAGELANNNTAQLAKDLEFLRTTLKFEKWTVAGGSWGTTLALKYAESFPERVKGLLLRAVFLCRPEDDDWMFAPIGARSLYPEIWENACKISGLASQGDVRPMLWELANSNDFRDQQRAAALSRNWEGPIMRLRPKVQFKQAFEMEPWEVNSARIFFHYQQNNYFLAANELLDNASRIAHLPVEITHGRFDLACTFSQAYTLHKSLPKSNLAVADLAGHSGSEPSLYRLTAAASERLYSQIK